MIIRVLMIVKGRYDDKGVDNYKVYVILGVLRIVMEVCNDGGQDFWIHRPFISC